jgi:hypothetical protein
MPAGAIYDLFSSPYSNEPPLPTDRTDQQGMGGSITLPGIADITITKQEIGAFQRFGNISSNWALQVKWTNESGLDAVLNPTVRVMEGKRIFDVAITSDYIAPLIEGNATFHLPMLSAGDHYLVISDTMGKDYGLFRIRPTVPAQTHP